VHPAKAGNQHGIGFIRLGAFEAAPAKSVDLCGVDQRNFVTGLMQGQSNSIGPGAGGFETGMDELAPRKWTCR